MAVSLLLRLECYAINSDQAHLELDFPLGFTNGTSRQFCRNLESFDCREPSRCAVVIVESRPKPVRFDGGDIPSIAEVERRSQLFLTDRMGAGIGTSITKHNTNRVPSCSVTKARPATYCVRSSPSKAHSGAGEKEDRGSRFSPPWARNQFPWEKAGKSLSKLHS